MKRKMFSLLCAIFAICLSMAVFSVMAGAAEAAEATETGEADAPENTDDRVMAPETVEIPYGDGGAVTLKLVESFDNSKDAESPYGKCTIENGEILLEGMVTCVDRYGIKAPELKAAGVLEGAKYIVFSVENSSDGDVWFSFQPEVPGCGNVFLGGEIEGGRFILVDKEGNMTVETEADGVPDTNNGRYGYTIPEEFQGYVFIPKELFCRHQQWSKPVFDEGKDPEFTAVGFNVYSDIAALYEVKILDMYTAEELPEYVAKPTPEPTPTKEPGEPTAKVAEPTEKQPEQGKTGKAGKGCGGFIAGTAGTTGTAGTAAWCVAILAAACAILIAKRREK